MSDPADRASWPVVVGGCHRSGTSLVRRLLDAHPRIHCGPEVPFFRDLTGDYRDDPLRHLRFFEAARSIVSEDELLEVAGRALVELHERAAAAAGKPRWADKAPENAVHLDGWSRVLGERWLYVHVVRNPLDTLASMVERPFPATLPPDLAGRAAHYQRLTAAGLDFAERLPDRCRVLIYEQLVSTPERVLGDLMRWLGERLEPIQLDFNSVPHQRGLEDPKVEQTAYVRADRLGRWDERLTADDADRAWAATAATWRRVDPDGRWFPGPAGSAPRSAPARPAAKAAASPPPGAVVLGASGGSGTRVVARICIRAGLYLGTGLSPAEDQLEIAAFYDRWLSRWLDSDGAPGAIGADLDAVLRRHLADRPDQSPWGFKEPRSVIALPLLDRTLPGLRFVHLVRDGRDLAFSSNLNQLRKHGGALLGGEPEIGPVAAIELWNRVNLRAAEYGERRLGDRYLRLRFEDLCDDPVAVSARLLAFAGLDGDPEACAAAVEGRPESVGRYRERDAALIAELESRAVAGLARFGYL